MHLSMCPIAERCLENLQEPFQKKETVRLMVGGLQLNSQSMRARNRYLPYIRALSNHGPASLQKIQVLD